MAGRGWLSTVLGLAVVATVLAGLGGCAQSIPGRARVVGAIDPGTVAGLPVTNGTSGPRSGVKDAQLTVENADGGEMDRLAVNAIADVQEFWTQALPQNFGGTKFTPVSRYISYDSDGRGVQACRTNTQGVVNAFYCSGDDSIAWDRGELLPMLTEKFGPMSVVTVLAHEMGHAVQYKLGDQSGINQATPTIVKEQQADCYAGTFFRWVAEGKSRHFQVSTGDGLNKVLATMFFIRDAVGSNFDRQGAHGSAFDRVSAFQFGFSEGPQRCAKITIDEYTARKTEIPLEQGDHTEGNLPVNDPHVRELLNTSLKQAYQSAFKQATPPTVEDGSASCQNAKPTPPASYCPASNSIEVDPDGLNQIGTPPKRGQTNGGGLGDFAAFAEIASRYALAAQNALKMPLEGPFAGLRTACLTGAWGGAVRTGDGNLQLTAGDLDKAIGELLQDHSLIAADVNGVAVNSGFARVEAFRIGFLEGSTGCANKIG
jgi:predicted metalloprotease